MISAPCQLFFFLFACCSLACFQVLGSRNRKESMRMALRLCSSRMLYFTLAPNTGMSVNKTHELSHDLLLQSHSPHFSPSPSISAPLSMFRSIETRACVLPCPTALTNAACSQMSRQRTQLHTTALGDASGLSASASLARSMRRLVTTSGVPCASASASVAVLTSLPSFFALSCPGVAACCVAHLFISVREHAPRLRLAIHGVQRTWHIAGLRAGQQYVQQASLLYV